MWSPLLASYVRAMLVSMDYAVLFVGYYANEYVSILEHVVSLPDVLCKNIINLLYLRM